LLSAIAGFGYILICFTDDALGVWMMVGACIVGCGEIGLVVSSTALVAQEAPPPIRGSVSGFFSLSGAIGIILATKVGGMLSGDGHYSAPFMMFGCFNMALFTLSIVVYIYVRIYPPPPTHVEDDYRILKAETESTLINDEKINGNNTITETSAHRV